MFSCLFLYLISYSFLFIFDSVAWGGGGGGGEGGSVLVVVVVVWFFGVFLSFFSLCFVSGRVFLCVCVSSICLVGVFWFVFVSFSLSGLLSFLFFYYFFLPVQLFVFDTQIEGQNNKGGNSRQQKLFLRFSVVGTLPLLSNNSFRCIVMPQWTKWPAIRGVN